MDSGNVGKLPPSVFKRLQNELEWNYIGEQITSADPFLAPDQMAESIKQDGNGIVL